MDGEASIRDSRLAATALSTMVFGLESIFAVEFDFVATKNVDVFLLEAGRVMVLCEAAAAASRLVCLSCSIVPWADAHGYGPMQYKCESVR